MSTILDKVYMHVDGVRALSHGHWLTQDRDVYIDYIWRLSLEKTL